MGGVRVYLRTGLLRRGQHYVPFLAVCMLRIDEQSLNVEGRRFLERLRLQFHAPYAVALLWFLSNPPPPFLLGVIRGSENHL